MNKSPNLDPSQGGDSKKIFQNTFKSPTAQSDLIFFNEERQYLKEFKRSETTLRELLGQQPKDKIQKKKTTKSVKESKPIEGLTRLEGFGLNDDMADKEFPTSNHLRNMPLDKQIRLERITYKLNSTNQTLMAIQLGFTNGVETPLFEAKGKCRSIPSISVDVDTSRTIRQLRMFVSENYHMCKLKMIDEKGKNIVNLDWTNKYDGRGKWLIRDIPHKKEIIGLYCTTAKYDFSIPCVGFILWTPPTEGGFIELEDSNSPSRPGLSENLSLV